MPTFKHSKYLNPTLMMVICGPTNCGKTYLLFKMLTDPNNVLDYDNLYIYTTTPEQNYYQFLKHGFDNGLNKSEIQMLFNDYNEIEIEDIPDLIDDFSRDHNTTGRSKKQGVATPQIFLVSDTPPPPSELNRKEKNLIIFDDCVNDRDQFLQKEYFTKGRHNSCGCIYLTQSFYGLDCQYIRRNTNVFILFHLNKRNLTHVIQDVDVGDEKQFKEMCRVQFAKPRDHKYILINIESPLESRLISNIFT